MAGPDESQQAQPPNDPLDRQKKPREPLADGLDQQEQAPDPTMMQHKTRFMRPEDFMDGFLRKAG